MGKKRKPKGRQAQELEASWAAICAAHAGVPKWAFKSHARTLDEGPPALDTEGPRGRTDCPSLTTAGGSTAKPVPMRYTGTKVLGIATMHKSSAVPVFSSEEAQDVAKMRRG